jgi:4-diphosphocytidyl-2-C-methyl-D-erythritol kinase
VLPAIAMPTPAVYRKFDELRLGVEIGSVEPDWAAWTHLSDRALLEQLSNDLESPAFALCPELQELRQRIERLVSRPVRMSGSGSSLFTLFDDPTEADRMARQIQATCRVPTRSVELAPSVE